MMLRFSLACACCAVLAGCGATRQGASPSPAGIAPGTYAMEICRGPCHGRAGDSVLVRGHLVIEAAEYPLSALPPVARKHLEDEEFMRMSDDDTVLDPNACFVLTRVREGHYHVMEGVELTRVKPAAGATIEMDLYHSPDAGYFVVLHAAGGELRGWGRFWSVPRVTAPAPPDSVRARRIGRPDRGLCIRAAEIEAAAREAQRTSPRP